jgi:hypothetical protein
MLKFCVEWTADFFYVHAEVEYGHLGNVFTCYKLEKEIYFRSIVTEPKADRVLKPA